MSDVPIQVQMEKMPEDRASTETIPASRNSTEITPDPFRLQRQELEWILAHPEFSRSASLVRFLTYICERTFEGAADEIREFSIAVEALGRKSSSFDSHVDPIVRVTARALRKKLQAIYKSDGQDRPLRIELPLGHYMPEFVPQGVENSTLAPEPVDPKTEDLATEALLPAPRETNLAWLVANRGWIGRTAAILLAVCAVFFVGFFFGRRMDRKVALVNTSPSWGEPVWNDEFNEATTVDTNKWSYQTGNQSGWGNRELEIYCAPTGGNQRECDPRNPNAFLDGAGHLVLRARRNADGNWTSARLTTRGLKSFQFGRIEARIKMPVGSGLWPSFWMLGANFDVVGWPMSGSVDIAENAPLNPKTNGLGPQMIRATVHGPRYFGGNGFWHDYRLPNGARVDDGSFHTYGIIWSPGMLQFYVDDPANIFFVQDASTIPEGGAWVFDKPFFLVLNLAVGGDWPGNPDASTPTPADMLVDYVRVYRIPTVPAPSIVWKPTTIAAGASSASIVRLESSLLAGRVRVGCFTDSPAVNCTLGAAVVNFSDTLTQEDTLTLSTESFGDKGRIIAPPGRYKVTITATTVSGDHSQLTVPLQVAGSL